MKSISLQRRFLAITLSIAALSLDLLTLFAAERRERSLMDFGWKFHLGNTWGIAQNLAKAATGSGPASSGFSDANWRTVNLPHDWAVELPFDEKADGSHGFKAIGSGFPQNNVAWYRKTLELPKQDFGRRLWLEFDGVFRDCVVFVNGWCMGRHESGYSSFRFDITDVANCGGTNVVALKVDASEAEGWFYEGAGIYRHVWLVKTAPIAMVPDGIFVFSEFKDNTPNGSAEIHINTQMQNASTVTAEAKVKCEIIAPDGKVVAKTQKSVRIKARSQNEIQQTARIPAPALWSPESPTLYRLVTSIESGGTVVDHTETEFGIRTVAFDANRGFLLNGRPYVIKGTCNHQDHAGVGVALPDRLQYFRIERLKEMGCNAYRCSHNPPTPELLEACDRLGMLVMDENRLLGSDAQNLDRLERLIRRDRNHPSVAIWSIANEEFTVQYEPVSARVAETMQARIKQLDPTRPITYAANMDNVFEGINSAMEVRGWNYFVGETNMDAYHAAHPLQPNVGTEQGSTVCTRGIYANEKQRGYVSAYDDNVTGWSHTAETWWSFFAERPWLSGAFVWTGFDYRGEPTPYWWPCINSHFGIMDTCAFPKDNFYYYQSWWSDKTVLHLLPHWNWPGKEGEEIDVRALSNCEEVELFLNGQSLGRQTMKKNLHLRWKVKYAPGTLSAKGYKNGKTIAETKVETTGMSAGVELIADRTTIKADAEDVSVVTVSAIDQKGRLVPTADNLIQFKLEGPGRILGVGNGNPSCHEPDIFTATPTTRSISLGDWRWTRIQNAQNPNLPEIAEKFDDSNWSTADISRSSGPLNENEGGVFRTYIEISEETLTQPIIELCFNRIDENGWVYVNGKKAGESHNWQDVPSFDVKPSLRTGKNTIVVAVSNRWGTGGINMGVTLQAQDSPPPPQWQRSVFNGLAQIIVQSTKVPGEIRLTAESTGLKSASVSIQSQKCVLRPQVP